MLNEEIAYVHAVNVIPEQNENLDLLVLWPASIHQTLYFATLKSQTKLSSFEAYIADL